MEYKKTRKIVQMGNSMGVSIPKEFLDELKLDQGSEVDIYLNDGSQLVMETKPNIDQYVDSEFVRELDKTLRDHDQVLKNLKDR
ncbi:AbrB/MazE/SpoVT family DNA-binding domain-containing protein [Tenuibacillus multivorans]|uniref:Putative addiction module antidote n=1 Tax=Tenuibacillus multivorans TaxID=237069 RepID=A0A1H0B240_9BACI|nr:AbrB/MazE/SpoVT family DNA-binding domain-containing protein [Tenuibacillus multivorans]GEL77574.1 hypothetical protein TMU01_18090 [Tenuibacillus multivorans]SDN39363.1 putative addiction module antidote [Tenuibacillus multivorans]